MPILGPGLTMASRAGQKEDDQELGTRQHCHDNVTTISGQTIFAYGIMAIYSLLLLHLDTQALTFL